MTSPLEQPPPIPSLADFTEVFRKGDDPRIHQMAIAMLEAHFDSSLNNQPEVWTPTGQRGMSLQQRCTVNDQTPSEYAITAGSTVEVSDYNPNRRHYRVNVHDTLGEATYEHTVEWGKTDGQMLLVKSAGAAACGTSHRRLDAGLVGMTVMHAHPEVTEIVAPTGFRAALRWAWFRGLRTLYLGQSRFPGMIHPYPDADK